MQKTSAYRKVALVFVFVVVAIESEAAERPCVNGIAQVAGVEPRANFTRNVQSFKRVFVTPEEALQKMGVERPFAIIEVTTKPGERLEELGIFTDQADLTILIDTTGNTQGHMAHMVRGDERLNDDPNALFSSYRYDGRLLWNRQDVKKNGWRFSDGLIIRYPKIPDHHRRALVDFMEKSLRGECDIKVATCVLSTHKVLFEIGGFNEGERSVPWFPSTFLRHLARTGLVADSGERMVPEIYTLNRNYQEFWNNLPHLWKIWKFIVPVLLNPATWGKRQFEQ